MKIAIFVNDSGQLVGIHEQGFLQLFDKPAGFWVKESEVAVALNPGMSLAEVRSDLRNMLDGMNGCKVILTGPLMGASLAMLKDLRLEVFSGNGLGLDLLDEVAFASCNASAVGAPAPTDAPAEPPVTIHRTAEGHVEVNLLELLKHGPAHPSRTVLLPILEARDFQQLKIICDHKPRWLDAELARLSLRSDTTFPKRNQEMFIMVYPL